MEVNSRPGQTVELSDSGALTILNSAQWPDLCQCLTQSYTTNMPDLDPLSLLEPFINLIDNQQVKETVRETARIYYEGDNGVTINLIPSIIIGLLALLGLMKLLGIPILSSFGLGGDEGGDGDYGAPTGGYGEPSTGYGRAYARSSDFDQTVADLQSQVAQLQASEVELRNQLYYNTPSSPAVNSNQIGFTS